MEGSDGGKGVVDSEEGGQGMVALVEGRSECSPYRISNDDDDNVVIVPASVCVASCHVAEWDTVPLARCVVRGSGDAVCLSFPLVGAGRRLTVVGGVVVVFVIAGGRTHSSGARLLGAGRCLPVVVLFACVFRVVGSLALFWADGVVCGGLGGVTWHAGETEGAPCVVDAGDVGVWLSGLLVGRLSCFVGDVGC